MYVLHNELRLGQSRCSVLSSVSTGGSAEFGFGDQVSNPTILWLPDDPTAGTKKGFPYPINYEAANDLALARIVRAISQQDLGLIDLAR